MANATHNGSKPKRRYARRHSYTTFLFVMKEEKKKKGGIIPILATLLPGVIAALSKKNRDESAPAKGGAFIRGAGATIVAGTAATTLAQSQGMIDCEALFLPDEYCGLIQGIALVAGCLMYIFAGKGKKKEKSIDPPNINLDETN